MATEIEAVIKALETVEKNLETMSAKAEAEAKANGKMSQDTATALENIGKSQRELADRIVMIEQRGTGGGTAEAKDESWGAQVVAAKSLEAFQRGESAKCRIEVKNTVVGADATVAPDRRPGVVPGAFQPLTIESLLRSSPTSSNAVEFSREATFSNSAAETAEGGAKPESAITFALTTMPVSTVAHWVKISKQLAADSPALAAYINSRMVYGVNQRVETQLVIGDGNTPNISGILNAGNFVPHGYTSGDLGSTLAKLALIRKIIGDLRSVGYIADAILLNPIDWAQIEIDLFTTAAGQVRVSVDAAGNTRLFGLPIVQSVGVPADTVAVGQFSQAYTVYNRSGVIVELSDSDSDNFTKNLVTVRAERRLALATEVPAAVRAGDLTPA